MLSELGGESFVFSEGDADWAFKRKVSAVAFYKEKLKKMIRVIHNKAIEAVETWKKQSEATGSTTFDMTLEIHSIF